MAQVNVDSPATFLITIFLLLIFISHKTVAGTLDPELEAAEKAPRIIKIRKNGKGDFTTVTAALNTVPSGNTVRTILSIGPGEYQEKIKVDRTKPFITFYGASASNMPILTYSGTAAQYGTVDSASVIVDSNYFMASNIVFQNSAPQPDGVMKGAQAVAMRISGDKAAFYNCKFLGFQDTLCDDLGSHYFKNCYIEGTIDYIFGNGKSLYLNTELHTVGEPNGYTAISAQARKNGQEDTGFSFVQCKVTGTGDLYLGRTWMPAATVVFAYTSMDSLVNPLGWASRGYEQNEKTVFFGEYQCTGPGANTDKRASFSKVLTDEEAKPFLDISYVKGDSWIIPPPKLTEKTTNLQQDL